MFGDNEPKRGNMGLDQVLFPHKWSEGNAYELDRAGPSGEASVSSLARHTGGTEHPASCAKGTLTYATATPVLLLPPHLNRLIMSAQEKKKYNKQPLSNLAWRS